MAFGARTTLAPRPPRIVGIRRQPGTGAFVPPTTPRPVSGISSQAHQAPWTPPPIPAGAYNPIRDIELQAGKRGVANTLEDLGTKNVRGEGNFLLGQSDIERQRNEQTTERDKALSNIAESFKRLGVRQTEQANGAGLLRGGALLQSAAKRAANQGKATDQVQQTYARQQEADTRALARLALARQQESEDIGTQGSRAEREQGQFGIDTQTLEAREAAENGYESPVGPAGAHSRGHLSVQPGAGFVRVGGPLKPFPNRFRRR
jgi:hypothetical protein